MEINKHLKQVQTRLFNPEGHLIKKNSADYYVIDRNNYHLDPLVVLADHIANNEMGFSVINDKIFIDGEEYDITDRNETFMDIFVKASDLWKKSFLRIPDLDNRKKMLSDHLKKVKWNTEGIPDKLKLDKEWANEIHDYDTKPIKIGRELIKDPVSEEGLLESWLQKLKGERKYSDTLIHFPMIMCDKSKTEELVKPTLPDHTVQAKIINKCSFKMTCSNYIELSNRDFIDKVSPKVDKGDHSKPNLTNELRTKLALRGVQAKQFLNKTKTQVNKSDKSLNKDFDTRLLEEYLSSNFRFGEERDASSEYEIDDNDGTEFIKSWFNLVSRIEEFKCLEFHDRVISEVIANSTRNLEKDYFIVRKVLGYDAYLIIKTTSLGSVHDPKPIFYSIIFKGKSMRANGIFEKVYDGGYEWSYTDFISTSRIRSSHQMNLMPQFQMMIYENIETLMTLTEIPSEEFINTVSETIKWCLCIHLQDREEFSAAASNYRYYYFSLFSGFIDCKMESEQLATKLPCVIRDPLHLLAIRRLINIHSELSADDISQATSILSFKALKDSVDMENDGLEDAEYDKLPTINTPFGFKITNARTFLKASYMSIYHDKDEAEKGPAAKQIVSKMCKQEKHMTELLKSDLDPESWSEDIGEDLGLYRFNAKGCILGADLVKKMLLSQRGLSEDSFQANNGYDDWIEETIITPCMLRTTYDILASTSSSYVDNGEILISNLAIQKKRKRDKESDDSDKVLIGKTVKCIEAIMQMRNEKKIKGMSVSDDLPGLLVEFAKGGSKMVIKIFKKNQLTGVREIYILTIVGRALQRFVEDLARSICKEIHEEKLTSPETKDSFIPEHKSECRPKSEGKSSVTINGSGDKTQWANYLHAKLISLPLFRLLPKKYHSIVAHVYNSNTKKEIEIPEALMESFLKNPDTDLEDPVLNEIKGSVLSGKESEMCKKDSSRIRCKGNTMQGIGHYCSSLLHLCALALLRLLLMKFLKMKGYDSCVNFEVSSDDKGFMVTVFIDKESQINKLGLVVSVTKQLRFLERVIDSCFGIRDSRLKSVTTISVSFEFNSVFYFGNSITTPLAKFTARCCDDSVQSTLHNRVSSFYSSCRQIRDNGGSGILCSLASLCQHIVMKCNLGFKTFGWFDNNASIDYNMYKFSHLGYRRVCNPITAGLCMSDFENIKHAHKNQLGSQYRMLMRRDIDSEDLPDQIHMAVSLWKKDKHEAMLKRLGIATKELTREDSLMILSSPITPAQMTKKLTLMVMSTGLARSMVMCQRSDLLRAGMYLMWHKAFRLNTVKISYHHLIVHLSKFVGKGFQPSSEYLKYMELELKNRFYTNRSKRMRLMPRQYKPLVSHSFVRDDVISYLRNLWLNQGDPPENYLIEQILSECVWIKSTAETFFENYEPSMLHRFINMIPTRKTKSKLLARGNTYGSNIIECMMRNNTSSDQDMITTGGINDPEKNMSSRKYIRDVCSRVSIWTDILFVSGNENGLCMAAISDITGMSRLMEDSHFEHCQSKQERLTMYVLSCLKSDSFMSTMRFYELGSNDYVDLYDSSNSEAKFEYSTHFGCPVISKKINNRITDYNCSNPRISKNMSNFRQYKNANQMSIDLDYKIKINRVRYSNGCLEVGDGLMSIAGLIGRPFENPSAMDLFVDNKIFTDTNLGILSKICLNDGTFINDELKELINSDDPVPRAARSLIYYHSKTTGNVPFTSSSNIQTDLDKKSRIRKGKEEFLKISEGTWEDMEDLVKMEMVEVSQEETEIKPFEFDVSDYFENCDDIHPELYSGVVRLEMDKKKSIDRIECIKQLKEYVIQSIKIPVGFMNQHCWDLWDKINDDNNQE